MTGQTAPLVLAAPAPLAGRVEWEAVIGAAGERCQCERAHAWHKKGGRCEAVHGTAGVRLLAGPVEPGPDPSRTLISPPPEELRAWCRRCWDHEVRAAARAARKAAREHAHDDMTPLF
ncbi:hypothetical protein [Actinomadura macrotermitis]|uniref:Uncharacterized protein n=1 Tax=Actinomadura macrotermitis TaxID=2585200 RepID=A0A7K0C8S4_9ACTN|nr:hypothetical protein [Actinomadura macrotermitis]MQY09881.1 hypothetical protein [Actinomadura macrotermitis]